MRFNNSDVLKFPVQTVEQILDFVRRRVPPSVTPSRREVRRATFPLVAHAPGRRAISWGGRARLPPWLARSRAAGAGFWAGDGLDRMVLLCSNCLYSCVFSVRRAPCCGRMRILRAIKGKGDSVKSCTFVSLELPKNGEERRDS